MLTERTLDSIQQEYLAALTGVGSNLIIDKVEGSLAYTLSRASAAIALQQDNRLLDLYSNSSLLQSTGARLDQLALGIVTRETALKATGQVLLSTIGTSKTLPANTILVEPTTGLQFITTSSANVIPGLETVTSITAVEVGVSSNLLAGVILYVSSDETIVARVGSSHTDNYYGDMSGGRDVETDSSFRQRIIKATSIPSTSYNNLLDKVLAYTGIDRAFVKTTVPGIVEIWFTALSAFTSLELESFKSYISPYLAPGMVLAVMQSTPVAINFTFDIRPYASDLADLSALSNRLSDTLTSYISSLNVGDPVLITSVEAALKPLASYVKTLSPTADVTVDVNQLPAIGNISFVFPSIY